MYLLNFILREPLRNRDIDTRCLCNLILFPRFRFLLLCEEQNRAPTLN